MLTLKHGVLAGSLSVLNQLVRRLVGIVSLIILARVLTPEDFGIVAIALIFLNFVDVVTETGGKNYLLSREKLTDEMVHTNWTLNFILKNSVALILAFSSYFIAIYYDDPRLIPIILVFSLQIFISALNSPKIVYKYKNQELAAIVKWQVGYRVVTTGVTISVAVIFESYWALVLGQLLSACFETASSYFISPSIPKFSLMNIRSQWLFSKWIMPQSLVNFFRSQIDAIYVSAIFDKAAMGAYNSMRYYASIPSTMLLDPIIGVSLTQLSEFKNYEDYFTKQLEVAIFLLACVCAPLVYLIYVHSDSLVSIVLGDKWTEYSDLLAIFSVFAVVMTINNFIGQVAMLRDETRFLLIYSIISLVLQILLFITNNFESIFQLAKYKIAVDVFGAVIFYLFILSRAIKIGPTLAISLLILPPIVFVNTAGRISSKLFSMENYVIEFLATSLSTVVLYLTFQFIFIFTLKSRVYCFDYITNKILMSSIQLFRRKYFKKKQR